MLRFIDLFCGIGGFRVAVEDVCRKYDITCKCVFSSDIDAHARYAYEANFGDAPSGDITKIDEKSIPDHDILFAGFPCQPFSIIGNGKGFNDVRGTLFFDIARILKEKRPKAFILENVKRLVSHNKGRTLNRILEVLKSLDYYVDYRVLNALEFGLPQKRERVFIVGLSQPILFQWPPIHSNYRPLPDVLERQVDKKHYASENIVKKRHTKHQSKYNPSIWHENKSGNISSYPYSCALRAGASYNYLLVDGVRRLTPRELLRLQGFPDDFKIVVPDAQVRIQAGNAVPVSIVKDLFESLLHLLSKNSIIKTTISSYKSIAKNNERKETAKASDC